MAALVVVAFASIIAFFVGSAKIEENRESAGRLWAPLIAGLQALLPTWLVDAIPTLILLAVIALVAVLLLRAFWSLTGQALRRVRVRVLALTGEVATWHQAAALTERGLIRGGADAYTNMMADYSTKFGARVLAARNELAALGYTDDQLDNYYENPTNLIGVRIVHERLGALALRLPG